MNTPSILYHLARADFYERARRYSFLLILAAVIFLGVLVNNGTIGLTLGSSASNQVWIQFQGENNSAWIGTMTVMVINTFLGLFGFFLVNDCIKRDIRTGVGQIIATTPVSRAAYLAGKWISNFVVLAVLVLILAVAAVIMVLLKQEAALDLGALLMPFLAVALPNMALTAALAVLFETVPWLRGAVGNVVYFLVWTCSLPFMATIGTVLPFFKDPIGYTIFNASIYASASAAYPQESIVKLLSVGVPPDASGGLMEVFNLPAVEIKIFNWPGLTWTSEIVAGQWIWAFVGLGLILLSAAWFARFDPGREGLRRVRVKHEHPEAGESSTPCKKISRIQLPTLSPLISKLVQANPFLGVLFAELRMLLNGRRWWWWIVMIGLNIAILGSPMEVTKAYLLPLAWLWPLAVWSEMGNRERKNNTSQMVFSSARPVLRQLPATWLAGVLATALFAIAGAVFFVSISDWPGLVGWAGGVIFVPSLALTLGVISSGNRVFEVVYLLWWYMGVMERTEGLDFTNGAPLLYLLAASGLLVLSMYWRGRQVRV